MPELSRFYGIVIQMYFGDHSPPHFHALYATWVSKKTSRGMSAAG
jgi:hypothetical protein